MKKPPQDEVDKSEDAKHTHVLILIKQIWGEPIQWTFSGAWLFLWVGLNVSRISFMLHIIRLIFKTLPCVCPPLSSPTNSIIDMTLDSSYSHLIVSNLNTGKPTCEIPCGTCLFRYSPTFIQDNQQMSLWTALPSFAFGRKHFSVTVDREVCQFSRERHITV